MKALSYWASQNVTKARILLVIVHLLTIINAIFLGTLLYLFDWVPPQGFLYATVVLGAVVLFRYPLYTKGTQAYRTSYSRRKIHDASLSILTSFAIALGVGGFLMDNSFYYEPTTVAATSARQVAFTSNQTPPPVEKPKASRKKRFKKQRQQLRRTLRLMKQKTSAPNGLHVVWRILLTILVIAIAVALGALVLALACSIACSGLEIVGIVVWVVGWAGIIALSIWVIFIIFKNRDSTKNSDKDIPPAELGRS